MPYDPVLAAMPWFGTVAGAVADPAGLAAATPGGGLMGALMPPVSSYAQPAWYGQFPFGALPAPAAGPPQLAAPSARRRFMTMVYAQDAAGGVAVVDQFKGRPYLTRRDMSSFKKVKRFAQRARRWFPTRRRKGKK